MVAGQTAIDLSDLRAFRTAFNLPAKDPQLILTGPAPGINSDLIEADLDLEWTAAVARNADILDVYSGAVFNAIAYAVDQNLADRQHQLRGW